MQYRSKRGERGSTSIQVLVILVPVFLGFIGFAVDLGRLYLIRGELKSAANAMALSAASRLIGTEAAVTEATNASRLPVENTGGYANKYDFGSVVVGQGNGRLSSALPEPTFYEDAASARGDGDGGTGSEAGASTARYVRIDLTADAPLIFWGLLPLGQDRRTPIAVRAVAGISAPLCTACGIEPIAIAPIDAEDTTNFGYVVNQRYTLGYQCTGQQPAGIAGATQRISYLMLNRYNEAAEIYADETSQAYRIGAGGLPATTNPAMGCVRINSADEAVWASAAPRACQQAVTDPVRAFTCGLVTRFNTSLPEGCENIFEAGNLVTAYNADSDLTDLDDFAAYTGNTRRIITVPVVETLSAAEAMNVIAFRQFLVQPTLPEEGSISATDNNGRFVVTYLGSPVPLRSGSFSGCSVTAGPGKVVLHR
jgi:Flp pilus assembly protein TadG